MPLGQPSAEMGQDPTPALQTESAKPSPNTRAAGWLDANSLALRDEDGTLITVELISLARCCPKNGDVPKSPLLNYGSLMPSAGTKIS
jgi:hypothetical protein